MKLLFDQNLSPRLVNALTDLYPDSDHVFNLNLDQASDNEVWNFALDRGFAIVTKDADFGDLSLLLGFPPKVIWIRRGNCSAREIENLLREKSPAILSHQNDPESGLLILF